MEVVTSLFNCAIIILKRDMGMRVDDPEKIPKRFYKGRIEDRVIDELIGLSHGVVLDGVVNKAEVEGLHKWLVANKELVDNDIINNLFLRVETILKDDDVDEDEAKELLEILIKYSGSDFEIGELLKPTTLPLDNPQPEITFKDKVFCFTGTFIFGTRKECLLSIKEKGAIGINYISGDLDYLIIGSYATDAWIHSTYGRKIEEAMNLKSSGCKLKITSEETFVKALDNE